MSRSFVVLLSSAIAFAPTRPAAQPNALFAFHSNVWLNLHHFVRLSARGGPPAAGLAEDESRQWAAGVDFYKPYGQRDLLFDAGMRDIKSALRGAEGKTTLDGIAIDANLKATLERLMPIYQKHWWPEHDRANRAWIAAVQPLHDLFQQVRQAASEQNVSVPAQLWHGMLFYTAGELTTRELKAHGIGYTQYAGDGLYTNLCGAGCREKIAEHWTPHLDGTRSSADALSALVASFK